MPTKGCARSCSSSPTKSAKTSYKDRKGKYQAQKGLCCRTVRLTQASSHLCRRLPVLRWKRSLGPVPGPLLCRSRVALRSFGAQIVSLKLNCLEPHQLVELARLLRTCSTKNNISPAQRYGLRRSRVWTGPVESVARNTIERIRQGCGENRSLEVAPGHFFRSDEFVDSVSLCCNRC